MSNKQLPQVDHLEIQNAPSSILTLDASMRSGFKMPPGGDIQTITRTDDGAFVLENIALTSVGLQVRGEVSKDEWLYVGSLLNRMEGSLQWLIGDWANGCERMWGSTYREIVEATGYEYSTVRGYAHVARNVNLLVRTNKLSFGHHKLLAPYSDDPKQKQKLIETAIEGKGKGRPMTIKQMREMLNGDETQFMSALANKEYRKSFNEIMKAIKEEKTPKKADIARLRGWLDGVEKIA